MTHLPNTYVTGTGQVIVNVHGHWACQGSWCVIHNPAPGPWINWPTIWVENSRTSDVVNGWMGRLCHHGTIHPCVEDNVPTLLLPHHADCDGCPCGPEHIGAPAPMDAEPRPLDSNGDPARRVGELSLAEKFRMDQDEAQASEVLDDLCRHLINAVVAEGGDHPGRVLVSAAYLDQINRLAPNQVKIVLQLACWVIAENALLVMERDGVLAQRFGIQLGKGFRDVD